jgi:hypothetical protein
MIRLTQESASLPVSPVYLADRRRFATIFGSTNPLLTPKTRSLVPAETLKPRSAAMRESNRYREEAKRCSVRNKTADQFDRWRNSQCISLGAISSRDTQFDRVHALRNTSSLSGSCARSDALGFENVPALGVLPLVHVRRTHSIRSQPVRGQ